MNDFKMHNGCKFSAFTLAEMMIVLLIMTIILAVMAPVVTTRMRDGGSGGGSVLSPWLWTDENARKDAYLASPDINNTRAAIGFGKNNIPNEGDNRSRLILNATSQVPNNLSFYRDGTYIGRMSIDTRGNLLFGNFDDNGVQNTLISMHTNTGDGDANTIGNNVALGYNSLTSISNTGADIGRQNIAIGANALPRLTNGDFNIGVGMDALAHINTGKWNIALGSWANDKSVAYTSGTIAIGNRSYARQNGAIAIGSTFTPTGNSINDNYGQAGSSIAYNSFSIAIGSNTRVYGESSIGIGQGSKRNGATSSGNDLGVKIGKPDAYAYPHNTTFPADFAIAIGAGSKIIDGAHFSIAIGSGDKGSNASSDPGSVYGARTNGSSAIAIGGGTVAYQNSIALGRGAQGGSDNTDNLNSIAIGTSSKATKMRTVAVGPTAEATEDSAYAMGYNAKAKGLNSIAIGAKETGASNTYPIAAYTHGSIAIGSGAIAGKSSKSGTTDVNESFQIAIGRFAKAYTGQGIAIGLQAESGDGSTTNTGEGNIAIGYEAKAYNISSIAFGRHAKANGVRSTAIGYSATVNDDRTIILGCDPTIPGTYNGCNGNLQTVYIPHTLTVKNGITGTVSTPSDSRLKHIGSESKAGLEKVKQLKPFNYTFKNDKDKTPRVGVIAQDLQKVFPDAVSKDSKGFLSIRMEDMFYAVVNAVKELDQRLAKLEASVVEILRSVKENKDTIKQLQKDNDKLKKENAELKARLDRIEAKLK